MKNFIKWIPAILLAAILLFILYQFLKDKPVILPPDETKIKQLEKQIEEKEKQIIVLSAQRDILLKANSQIDTHIIYLNAQIDSSINKDSTNAISEYRQSITLFNWLPDAAKLLTFREIGIGAKIITEASGMKLKIKNYEQALAVDKEIITLCDSQKLFYKNISAMKDTAIDFWKKEFEKTQSFWFDRFIFYTGIGINYNGTNFAPGIQVGIGIRIVTIKF